MSKGWVSDERLAEITGEMGSEESWRATVRQRFIEHLAAKASRYAGHISEIEARMSDDAAKVAVPLRKLVDRIRDQIVALQGGASFNEEAAELVMRLEREPRQ